jgi:hypothetical protein
MTSVNSEELKTKKQTYKLIIDSSRFFLLNRASKADWMLVALHERTLLENVLLKYSSSWKVRKADGGEHRFYGVCNFHTTGAQLAQGVLST